MVFMDCISVPPSFLGQPLGTAPPCATDAQATGQMRSASTLHNALALFAAVAVSRYLRTSCAFRFSARALAIWVNMAGMGPPVAAGIRQLARMAPVIVRVLAHVSSIIFCRNGLRLLTSNSRLFAPLLFPPLYHRY